MLLLLEALEEAEADSQGHDVAGRSATWRVIVLFVSISVRKTAGCSTVAFRSVSVARYYRQEKIESGHFKILWYPIRRHFVTPCKNLTN